MAVRSAALEFEDGRRADDAEVSRRLNSSKRAGPHLKAAIKRIERTALPLLDALEARASTFNATKPQVAAARAIVSAFLDSMAANVLYLARAFDSPSASERVEQLIGEFRADANSVLALAETKARTEREALGRAKPGAKIDLEWKKKVFSFCDKAGLEAVADQGIGAKGFLANVKSFYSMSFNDKPKDPRRTAEFRQEWLDRKAGL